MLVQGSTKFKKFIELIEKRKELIMRDEGFPNEEHEVDELLGSSGLGKKRNQHCIRKDLEELKTQLDAFYLNDVDEVQVDLIYDQDDDFHKEIQNLQL